MLGSCAYGNEPLSSLKQHTSGLAECLLGSQDGLRSVESVTSQIPKYKYGRALLPQPAQAYKLLHVKSLTYAGALTFESWCTEHIIPFWRLGEVTFLQSYNKHQIISKKMGINLTRHTPIASQSRNHHIRSYHQWPIKNLL